MILIAALQPLTQSRNVTHSGWSVGHVSLSHAPHEVAPSAQRTPQLTVHVVSENPFHDDHASIVELPPLLAALFSLRNVVPPAVEGSARLRRVEESVPEEDNHETINKLYIHAK